MNNLILSTSRARCVVGRRAMSAFSHMSDNDPSVLEQEKQKNISSKDKAWNEKLASHSEAAVKADQEQDKPFDQLQRESTDQLKKG